MSHLNLTFSLVFGFFLHMNDNCLKKPQCLWFYLFNSSAVGKQCQSSAVNNDHKRHWPEQNKTTFTPTLRQMEIQMGE